MTAALIRTFGDMFDTRIDCCCIAAAVAPLTLRDRLLYLGSYLRHAQTSTTCACIADNITEQQPITRKFVESGVWSISAPHKAF